MRPGQEVEVKVETFTFTKYGVVHGTVLTVSNDAVEDEKRGLLYSTRIQLHENSVLVGGSRVALTPGMAVRAEVRTQTRKIIEYFTSPFKESIEESLKERWVMISSELRENSNRKRFKALALWIPISYLILSILPFAYEMLNQIPDNLIESKGILSTKKLAKTSIQSYPMSRASKYLLAHLASKATPNVCPIKLALNL
ncbi:hypothetical protein PPUN110474_50330 [Pseudomonas putida]|nr:hypothetical protein PPUN110474_50330 [Pseudomonas putida]